MFVKLLYFSSSQLSITYTFSNTISEKYSLKIGDIITLKEQYVTKEYEFKVSKIYHYPASLSIFINRDYFNDIFGNKEDYFNGYFSDEEITNMLTDGKVNSYVPTMKNIVEINIL